MKQALFSAEDIQGAIADFVMSTPAREAPAIGKNGAVLVYGQNDNPYRPTKVKVDDEPTDAIQTIGKDDIGIMGTELD